MSRYEFESEGKRYLYVIGVDELIYVQVYDRIIFAENVKLIFEANGKGVFTLYYADLTKGQSFVLGQIEAAYHAAAKNHEPCTELDVEQLYRIALEFNVNLNPSLIATILNGDLDE